VRFPRRVTHCLVMVLLVITLLFRYPLGVGHELGSDTTFIHSLGNSLLSDGRAAWILNPTSYFGLYALSYPSAIPFLLASLSAIGDIPIEGAMLFLGIAFAVAGTLAAFLAARLASEGDRLALLAALLFSIAPFYVKDTMWVGSSRGFVTALVPAVFLLLLRHLKSRDIRYAALAVLLVLSMAAIHRMGSLAILILIAYFFALPFHRLTQKLRFALVRYEGAFRIGSTGASVSGFLVVLYLQFLFPGIAGANIAQQYGTGVLLVGESFPIIAVNMAISLTGKVGILLPLALVGLLRHAWRRPKEGRDKFLLVAVFLMIPLLSLRDYIAEFLVYVFVLLVALSVIPRGAVPRRKVIAVLTILLLLGGALGFSWVMKDYWRNQYYTDSPIPDELYGASVYTDGEIMGTLLSNEGLSAGRVTAVSGSPTLPIGGASIHWYGPQQLTFGFVRSDRVFVEAIPITAISFHTDAIYFPVNVPNAKDDYETIFYNSLGDLRVQRVLARYDVHYVLLDNGHLSQFQSYIWRDSPFVVDVQRLSYKVYDSPSHSIWFLG